ncbi:hypothetical protein ACCO45_004477 [Purpureocillium lilacinum]|uniref:Uncharacterized protein n=1 Tax=Purpureocillium lilacinum TaxID=33203 RepID=A0ACC4E5D5_PURLI
MHQTIHECCNCLAGARKVVVLMGASVSTAAHIPTHRLLDTLRIRGQLLRCYTQNIDMLEEKQDCPSASNMDTTVSRSMASCVTFAALLAAASSVIEQAVKRTSRLEDLYHAHPAPPLVRQE